MFFWRSNCYRYNDLLINRCNLFILVKIFDLNILLSLFENNMITIQVIKYIHPSVC